MNWLAKQRVCLVAQGLLIAAIAWTIPSGRERGRDDTATIHGRVLDDFQPVAQAVVRVKGFPDSVETNSRGSFALKVSEATSARLVASRPGYLIAGADWQGRGLVTIRLARHTTEDAADYSWVDPHPDPERPQQCGNCHGQIFQEWAASSHAQASTNRRFLNLYDGTDWSGRPGAGWNLLEENPHGRSVCFSCHVPSLEPGDPALDDLRMSAGVQRQGVHCDFCHKIADVQVEQVGLDHGRFAMSHVRPRVGQLFFGPLDDVDRGEDVYLPLYRKSRYCASCHEGVLFGTHAYSTYSEWLASPHASRGVQCQNCHMPPTGLMRNIAPGNGGIDRDPATLASHRFPGGDAHFLRDHLGLSVKSIPADGELDVAVQVSVNGVGHRVPTGHPSRNLILCVTAADATGAALTLLEGPVLPRLAGEGPFNQGGFAGLPGRMYAKVLEGVDGRQPVPYWHTNRVAFDTRLLPDQVDRVRFRFRVVDYPIELTAWLVYRRFTKYEADQKSWPDNEILIAESKTLIRSDRP